LLSGAVDDMIRSSVVTPHSGSLRGTSHFCSNSLCEHPRDVAGEMKMKNEKIVLSSKTAHSQRLKSFRTSAALMLTTLMLVVATTTGGNRAGFHHAAQLQ
jgi:hypothetical protein